jgi:thiosulfate/3-mercaptopyruvate sulfurtransferase
MAVRQHRSRFLPATSLSTCLLLLLALPCLPTGSTSTGVNKPAEPWTDSQTIQPGEVASQLTDKSTSLPTIVYVGPRTLFAGGHIPGAVFHGAAANQESLAKLKKWAESVPRATPIVLYCGCCPFDKCPNIRPAFAALNSLGFHKLQVLILPTSFVADWVEKGYPIQKGD